MRGVRRLVFLSSFLLFVFASSGCMTAYKQSVGSDPNQVFRKIYLTDFDLAWEAVKDAIRSSPIEVDNREGGYIRTKWTDNTSERNFVDAFGPAQSYLKAEYRLKLTIARAFYNGEAAVKVIVQKDQRVQRDVLEGWRMIESDSIDENTLLYRIGRLIYIKSEIKRMEDEKTKSEMEDVKF